MVEDSKTGEKKERIVFNGPSVDEVCLLEMCADTGIGSFVTRDATCYDININDTRERYENIKLFEFTSERKAMSMVVKHPTKANKAICFVKGADSSVFPMCKGYSREALKDVVLPETEGANLKIVEKEVEKMAKKGLRTLLYGMKEIDWDGSRDPYDLTCEEVESDLVLLAATGVEDLLQELVKECIEDFREAGISVWMLTGDKGLTALEIGVSCGLIPQDRQEMREDISHQVTNTNALVTDMAINDDLQPGESVTKVLMFEDDDNDATVLFEKIKKFLTQVEG